MPQNLDVLFSAGMEDTLIDVLFPLFLQLGRSLCFGNCMEFLKLAPWIIAAPCEFIKDSLYPVCVVEEGMCESMTGSAVHRQAGLVGSCS